MTIIEGDSHRLPQDPTVADGLTGDFCIQTTSGHYWAKESGSWADLGPANEPVGAHYTRDFNGLNNTTIVGNAELTLPPGGVGWRINAGASDYDIYGITAAPSGTIRLFFNANGTRKYKFKHESTNAAAPANRFVLPKNSDYEINEYESVYFRYDGTLSRWHMITSQD